MPDAALYGLVGYPLDHSFSPKYFTEKFAREGIQGTRYERFPLPEIAGLPALLDSHPNLKGFNVTIPHKQAIIPYLDGLDETARTVGAVNTVRIREGKLEGFNTDVLGFEQSLATFLNGVIPQQTFVLGTGGAARAVAFVLNQRRIPFQFVSRRPANSQTIFYSDLPEYWQQALASSPQAVHLLINTTPLGTYPETEVCPEVPWNLLGPQDLVYDLIYNPAETLLLRLAQARGAKTKNGLEMLHLQADKAWEIWVS